MSGKKKTTRDISRAGRAGVSRTVLAEENICRAVSARPDLPHVPSGHDSRRHEAREVPDRQGTAKSPPLCTCVIVRVDYHDVLAAGPPFMHTHDNVHAMHRQRKPPSLQFCTALWYVHARSQCE